MTMDPTGSAVSGIVDRIKNILLTPQAEWDRISAEPADLNKLYVGYVLPLAALAAICGFIGMSVFGLMGLRVPITIGLVSAVLQVGLYMACIYVLALIANALAPSFGSQQDVGQAHKLMVYSFTASLLAGVIMIFPPLAILGLVGLYSFVLLYIGLPRLMKTPEDKRIGYFATLVIAGIVVFFVTGYIVGAVQRAMGFGVTSYTFG